MAFNNLSKTFKYVNDNGDAITFTFDSGFLISKPEGIDTVEVSINEVQGINQTGSTMQSVNVQSRPVTISGRLVGENQASNKDRLLAVIRPDLNGKLYADDFYLEVRPTSTPTIEARNQFAAFQFSLLAAYPYWQRKENVNASLNGVMRMFKFPWNQTKKYQFGEEVKAQFINVYNGGQVPIPFTVTFSALGVARNPQIIDVKTNKYLLIKKNIDAGERLVVEITHERMNCYSSVDGECRGAIDLNSSFNRLAVGDNVIKPDADSGKDNLNVEIKYAIEVVGVSV